MRTFAGNWSGTGEIINSGDAERILLDDGEYMESGIVETNVREVELLANNYGSGDAPAIKYRHGASELACEAAAWNLYSFPFTSLGYVQVRIDTSTVWYLSGGVSPSSCLFAYDPFEAIDLSSSYTNLANVGVYTLAPGVAPTHTNGIGWTLDGATQYLDISGGTGPTCPKPFSFIARINPTGDGTSRTIIAGGAADAIRITLNTVNRLRATIQSSTVGNGTTAILDDAVVAFTYDGLGNYVFYYNGVSDGSGTNDRTPSGDIDRIGRNNSGADYYSGDIKKLALYDVVLTPAQIAAISADMV